MNSMKRFLLVLPLAFLIILTPHVILTNARKLSKKGEHSPPPGGYGGDNVILNLAVYNSETVNVLDYGARGDGTTDDTQAFEKAWAVACKQNNPTMLVPGGHTFLVGLLEISGTGCSSNAFFQLNGNIDASTGSGGWNSLQWLDFTNFVGLTIQGLGSIDGHGSTWWNSGKGSNPTALRVADSTGVNVNGITIVNSARAHLKFDNCENVQVSSISINSPGNSPNTDGIHLQNSKNVEITQSRISSGDDCISIQTGCTSVTIDGVTCGPSHGISIGGLGIDGTEATVSDIAVTNSKITDSLNAVRIKTFPGGTGNVNNVSFTNILVLNVDRPIVINQYYSENGDVNSNNDKRTGVGISNVMFGNIRGEYNIAGISLDCCATAPCQDITLSNIVLDSASSQAGASVCSRASVQLVEPVDPNINC